MLTRCHHHHHHLSLSLSLSRPRPRPPPVYHRQGRAAEGCLLALLRVLARQLGQPVRATHHPAGRESETALFSSCPPSRSSRDDVRSIWCHLPGMRAAP
ncbi:hypothetical protein V8C37DRAFT_378839 [Trichoderma ceciliae]